MVRNKIHWKTIWFLLSAEGTHHSTGGEAHVFPNVRGSQMLSLLKQALLFLLYEDI